MQTSIQQTRLSNGMMVITDRVAHVESVNFGCWFGVGSRDEAEHQLGCAHFLEHMAFKGTKKRSAKQISEEIEAVGGYMNAYTARDRTAYHMRLLSDDARLGMDILADILQYSSFLPHEFERERKVIIQEIGHSEDTPDDIIFDYFQAQCYPNQAIGRPILGNVEVISNYQPQDVEGFMQSRYAKDNMVVCAAGKLDHDGFCRLVEDYFTDLPATAQVPNASRVQPYFSSTSQLVTRSIEQVHLLLGYEAFSYLHEDFTIFRLLGNILGDGSSSRLFQRIREELGLAYSVQAMELCHHDAGILAIYAGTDASDVEKLLSAIKEEIAAIQNNVTEDELNRAKAQFRAGLLMGRESMGNRMERLASHHLLYGKILPDSELLARIDAVGIEDCQNLAVTIFSKPPSITMLGPLDTMPAY